MTDPEPGHPSVDPSTATPLAFVAVGSIIAGRYEIERELGRGGMAAVYLAHDRKHGRPVALKALESVRSDPLAVERFMREIDTIAKLSHPHILPLYDSGDADGVLYFVMPYVQGQSLRVRLERGGRLPVSDVVRMALEVCDALGFAHQRGVVHRDIKPENLLIADGYTLVADFGIAQATVIESFQRLTTAGVVVGTPAYMSPEQACGDEVDQRSDLYSLACVMYEALVGHTPHESDDRGHHALAHRLDTPIPSIRQRRLEVPLELERAVARGLETLPRNRFASAGEFADAIRAASRPLRRARRRWAAGAILAAAAAVTWLVVAHGRPPAGVLDATRYAVFPFQHQGGTAPALLAGDNCERLFGDALARWQGVTPVSDLVLREGMLGHTTTLGTARSLAAAQRAGRLIWGSVIANGTEQILVEVILYDVATGDAHARAAVRVAADLHDAPEMFNALADSLLTRVAGAPLPADMGSPTRSVPALEAYAAGHRALATWDLSRAEEQFRTATRADPDFAQAELWLAQAGAWASPAPPSEWAAAASRSYVLRQRLGRQDRERAAALFSLATGDFPGACARYAGLVRADSLDFIAWYGLGQCLAGDRLTIRDPASPSGWRFRTSEHAAIQAYLRALALIPSFQQAYIQLGAVRLGQLLFTEPGVYRPGYALGPKGDTILFGSFPALQRDTLAFVPYSLEDLGRDQPWPATYGAAIAHNRRLLGTVTGPWVRTVPSSSAAHLQLSRALESMGQLESPAAGDTSAMSEALRARETATTAGDTLAAGVAGVRLDLKLSRFASARARADSLLAQLVHQTVAQSTDVASLAALTGRVHRAVDALRLSAPLDTIATANGIVVPPTAVAAEALAFAAYAAFGAPIDSMRVTERRASQLVREWLGPGAREPVLTAMLEWPATLAYPLIGIQPVHSPRAENPQMQAEWALARGDTGAARRLLLDPRRQLDARLGPESVDEAWADAVLWLAIGDTLAATSTLDRVLNSLPRYGARLLDDVEQPALLVRAMALRGDLAADQGDPKLAKHWADAVQEMWGGADAELQPVVGRTRRLSLLPGS